MVESDATLHPIHRSMGVSRSESMADRSSAGAEKASLTPSKSPMCNKDDDVRGLDNCGLDTKAKPSTDDNSSSREEEASSFRGVIV